MFSFRSIKREKELIDKEIDLYRKEKKLALNQDFANLIEEYVRTKERYNTEIQIQKEKTELLKFQFNEKQEDYRENLKLKEELAHKRLDAAKDYFNTIFLSKDEEIEMLRSIINAFTAKLPDIKLESLGQTVSINGTLNKN